MRENERIVWDAQKRTTLSAALAITGSSWIQASQLWASQYPDDAAKSSSITKLRDKLNGQWGERKKPGNRTWSEICTSCDDLWANATGLMRRLEAIFNQGISNVRPPAPPMVTGRNIPATTTPRVSGPQTPVRSTISLQSPSSSRRDQSSETSVDQRVKQMRDTAEVSRASGARITSSLWTPMTPTSDTQAVISLYTGPVSQRRSSRARTSLATSELGQKKLEKQQRLLAARSNPGTFVPVPESVARPDIAALLYRFYDVAADHAVNEPFGRGFLAGWFTNLNSGIQPLQDHNDHLVFNIIEHHVNGRKIPSHFISTTSNFFWAILQAWKLRLSGKDVRLSIIDGKAAAGPDGKFALHPREYYRQLKEKLTFDPGKWRHAGNSEVLIWGKIASSAVICDFPVQNFMNICNANPGLSTMIRPHLFYQTPMHSTKAMRAIMETSKVALNKHTVQAMVDIIHFAYSSMTGGSIPTVNAVTQLVSEIIQGWSLKPATELSTSKWHTLAEGFVQALEEKFAMRVAPHRTFGEAFLYGAFAGFGELHWQLDDNLKRRMFNTAASFGLPDPERVYDHETSPLVEMVRSFALQSFKTPSPKRRRAAEDDEYQEGRQAALAKRIARSGIRQSDEADCDQQRHNPVSSMLRSRVFAGVVIPREPVLEESDYVMVTDDDFGVVDIDDADSDGDDDDTEHVLL